jgi:hypothetical protein
MHVLYNMSSLLWKVREGRPRRLAFPLAHATPSGLSAAHSLAPTLLTAAAAMIHAYVTAMSGLVCVQGVQLEPRYGHVGFAALLAELLLLSHGLTALLAWGLAEAIPGYRYT